MQGGIGQHHSAQAAHAARLGNASSAPFYQTPAYQNHLEQLGTTALSATRKARTRDYTNTNIRIEQEYDAAADIMDEGGEGEDASGPGPYPGAAYAAHAAHGTQQQMSPSTTGPMESNSGSGQPQQQQQQQQGMSMTQLLDPSIDWDPFGLSASMAFPSSFSFDTSNMR